MPGKLSFLPLLSGCLIASALVVGGRAEAVEAVEAVEGVEATTGGAPQLIARWLASCDPGEQRTYFKIEIHHDGTVRYEGGPHAEQAGERTARIKPYDVRYLVARAADFVRAPPPPARRVNVAAAPQACMEFETRVDGRMQARRESIETRASEVFSNDMARKVPLLSWVCPGRAVPEEPDLTLKPFCARWVRDGKPRSQ